MSHSASLATALSIHGAGKALEQAAFRFRSYFLPSHLWTYLKIVREHGRQPVDSAKSCVCFDFTKVDIDQVSGRYVFSLVRDFEALGLQPCYRKNYRFLASMRHKRHKRLLYDRPFTLCDSVEDLPSGSLALEITDRPHDSRERAHPRVRVRYDEAWPVARHELPMTFFVHPLLYDEVVDSPPLDTAAPREWRLFFSGKTTSDLYKSTILPLKFGKMSRDEILQTVERALPPQSVYRVGEREDLAPGAVREPCFVWSNSAKHIIPRAEWLSVLSRADFFLACPGKEMPLCHNLIEALSRGVIPILEHPEYLDPPMEHGLNCIVFHGPDELVAAVKRALSCDKAEIVRLRSNAYAYFQKHLAPGKFAERILKLGSSCSKIDLILNAYRARRSPAGCVNVP